MTIESKAWPDKFFERIRIDDPAFKRPHQGTLPLNCVEVAANFPRSLLMADRQIEEVINFTVSGIAVAQNGSKDRPWNQAVASSVVAACTKRGIPSPGRYEWFAVQLRWFVMPCVYRQDLDNFRLKPILDCLTRAGVWSDDDITHVRAIYNEAHLIDSLDEQRVEVTVYGVLR